MTQVTQAPAAVPSDDTHRATAPVTPAQTSRTWTISTVGGIKVSGPLSSFDKQDPSETDVPADQLLGRLDDLKFVRYYGGLIVEADLNQGPVRSRGPAALLCPQMEVEPFSDDPAEHTPTVAVEIVEGSDDWIEHLDPAGVTELAAKLRAQADVLDQAATDLAAARADWAANVGGQ